MFIKNVLYVSDVCSRSAQVVLNFINLFVDPARYAFESGRRWSDHLYQLRYVLSGYLTESGQRLHAPKAVLFVRFAVEVLQNGHGEFHNHVVENLRSYLIPINRTFLRHGFKKLCSFRWVFSTEYIDKNRVGL